MSYYAKPKIKKSEEPTKTPFILHRFHNIDEAERIERWKQGYYQIASFDPATRNLALRIEKRYADGSVEPLVFFRADVKDETEESPYNRISALLNEYVPLLSQCHIIIIERQLPCNYRSLRISQHILSYLMEKLRDNKLLTVICEVDAKIKYKRAPSIYTEKVLKKDWGPREAEEILCKRKDTVSLEVMGKERKKDDLADTVLLIEETLPALGLNFPYP